MVGVLTSGGSAGVGKHLACSAAATCCLELSALFLLSVLVGQRPCEGNKKWPFHPCVFLLEWLVPTEWELGATPCLGAPTLGVGKENHMRALPASPTFPSCFCNSARVLARLEASRGCVEAEKNCTKLLGPELNPKGKNNIVLEAWGPDSASLCACRAPTDVRAAGGSGCGRGSALWWWPLSLLLPGC